MGEPGRISKLLTFVLAAVKKNSVVFVLFFSPGNVMMSRLAGGCSLIAVRGPLSGERSGFGLLAMSAHLRCL